MTGSERDVLEVLTFPDSRLRVKAEKVTVFDGELARLAEAMMRAMYDNSGMGLAAPQVGEAIQMVVTDFNAPDHNPATRCPKAWVNPEIRERTGEMTTEEGCLSLPGFRALVARAESVTVVYQTLEGESRQENLTGLDAVCLQHEIDHLSGKLFIDHLPPVRREMIKKKLTKQARSA